MIKLNSVELAQKADDLRIDAVIMGQEAGGAHLGGGLSAMDIMTALYFNVMNIDPEKPDMVDRDRFILSAGHKAVGYVPVLAEAGFFSKDLLKTFNKLDSPFGMHPDMNKIPGCEASTGSLGHGLPIAVGMALALRMDNHPSRLFVLLGDGELHEGTNWEAAMGAAHHKLDKLTAIIDYNKCSMDGPINEVMSVEPLVGKWESFGWNVIRIDGHNMDEILEAFKLADTQSGPTMIIADTVKGKGMPFAEGDYLWHYGCPSDEQIKEIKKHLGRE
jgi:transketolase